jgi:arginyl-tRNA synthetase
MTTYTLQVIRDQARRVVENQLGREAEGRIRVEYPPAGIGAALAVPLFPMSKALRQNPHRLAETVASSSDKAGTVFAEITAEKGFVNFRPDWRKLSRMVFADFFEAGEAYGGWDAGGGGTVVIDYSAPNIAKPFSVGHLRSTVIGQSLSNILSFLGYRVIGDNHIGDWGTQFGKLIAAYKRWGDEDALGSEPIRELLRLYVRFHEEAEKDPALEEEGRQWFARLERGDPDARKPWLTFRELSLKKFERMYRLLGVQFQSVLGESDYEGMLADVVRDALEKGVAEQQEAPPEHAREGTEDTGGGAEWVVLIPLAEHGIETPLLLQKSDGTSLYATRDIATIRYRIETWKPAEVIYVVGGEQQLYFKQLFKAFELLGYDTPCVHVWFGMVRLPEGRMSTRKGRVVFLEDVLGEAIERAQAIVSERDMDREEKENLARIVGIGAVKYADLSQDRTKDVVFDWDKMLALDGNSGPYLQYAYTRALSIIRKSGRRVAGSLEETQPELLEKDEETAVIWEIARFPEVVGQAAKDYKPSYIANYLFNLSQVFNRFYVSTPVLGAESESLVAGRLMLVEMVRRVLWRGLNLLGIECPDRM